MAADSYYTDANQQQDPYTYSNPGAQTNAGTPQFIPTPGSQHPYQGPSGIPDPANPGYDTTGMLLGTTYNPTTGQQNIPNPITGMTATSYWNPQTGTGMPNSAPNANAFGVSVAPTGGGQQGGSPYGYGPVSPYSGQGTYPDIPIPDYLQQPFQIPGMPSQLSTPYSLPTMADLQSTPGYMSRYQQGLDARQRSAAAQGTLLNGGTLKALDRYGQDYASNEYQNLVGEQLGARGQNLSEYQTQVANALGGRQQQINDWSTLTNQPALNRYGSLYQQYMDLISNNRNSMNDYTNALTNAARVGAGTATAGNPGTGSV